MLPSAHAAVNPPEIRETWRCRRAIRAHCAKQALSNDLSRDRLPSDSMAEAGGARPRRRGYHLCAKPITGRAAHGPHLRGVSVRRAEIRTALRALTTIDMLWPVDDAPGRTGGCRSGTRGPGFLPALRPRSPSFAAIECARWPAERLRSRTRVRLADPRGLDRPAGPLRSGGLPSPAAPNRSGRTRSPAVVPARGRDVRSSLAPAALASRASLHRWTAAMPPRVRRYGSLVGPATGH